jgi:hypothetical protein
MLHFIVMISVCILSTFYFAFLFFLCYFFIIFYLGTSCSYLRSYRFYCHDFRMHFIHILFRFFIFFNLLFFIIFYLGTSCSYLRSYRFYRHDFRMHFIHILFRFFIFFLFFTSARPVATCVPIGLHWHLSARKLNLVRLLYWGHRWPLMRTEATVTPPFLTHSGT